MTRTAATIVAKNRLPMARVLAESFREHHPAIPFHVLLADEVAGCFEPEQEPFEMIELPALAIPDRREFLFQYAREPLSYASTPWLLEHLLDRGFEEVVFFKQESMVAGSLDPVFELLRSRSIVLTPHLLGPLEGEDAAERELNILLSGVFNIGLLGVSESDETRRFLSWWQDRVYRFCRHAVGEGLHYEQRWVDLVPAYFENVEILRDPGGNVGHWNLPERSVEGTDGRYTVDGRPARLFRFSGFDPGHPDDATRHSNRLRTASIGAAGEVFRTYARRLRESGWDEAATWTYAWSHFDNGVVIPDLAREIYLDLEERSGFGDPFVTGQGSFFNWLNAPARADGRLTRLWFEVYRRRADLQRAFPDVEGNDLPAYLAWTISSGLSEHLIPQEFAPRS